MAIQRPQRVLMTVDSIGGVWTYALELAAGLQRWNIDVCLAVMGKRLTPDQAREAAALPNVGVCESNYKLEWMDDPWADVESAGAWLLELESEFNPDIIHLNGYAHGALPFDAPKMVVAHSCVCSWWEAVKGETAPREWDIYREHVSEGLRGADLVVAPSAAMLNALLSQYGEAISQSRIIPNGRTAPNRSSQPKQPIFLAAGRLWDEAKNIRALTSIAPTLPWPVYIAGEAAPNARPETPNVHWLGKLPGTELWKWHQEASVFVSPARYEPFGLTLLEAALCGTALVVADIPSLREVWQQAAVFFDPNDSHELETKLMRLAEHPGLVAEWGNRARRQARKYTADKMTSAYVESYAALLQSETMPAELAAS